MELVRTPSASIACLVRSKAVWASMLAALIGCSVTPIAGEGLQEKYNYPRLPPEVNRIPNARDRDKMNEQHFDKRRYDAANAARKQLMSDDTAKLVLLAMALKEEMERSPDAYPSQNMIRETAEIERLARDVKDKMKLTVGSN